MVEFNVSSALGGMEIAEVNRLLAEDVALQAFIDDHGLTFADPVAGLVAYLRDFFGHDLGTIALVDATASFSETEPLLQVLADLLGKHGVEAVATHMGALHVGNHVEAAGRRVDIVYRFFTLGELVGDANLAAGSADLLSSLARVGVPVVSPLSTSCFGNKRSLALLWTDQARETMAKHEQDAVERLIPWTLPLDVYSQHSSEQGELLRQCVAERNTLVLKPAFGAEGRGVVVGWETTQEDWEFKLSTLNPARFVVQRAVSPVDEMFRTADGAMEEPWRLNYGFFHFGHQFAGGYLRGLPAGASAVIAERSGASTGCLFVDGEVSTVAG